MNFNNELENKNNPANGVGENNSLSIEDFIKELEAKEKDLLISSDLAIEIDEADFDDTNPPEFLKAEFAIEPIELPEAPAPGHHFMPGNRNLSNLEDEAAKLK